MWLEYEQRKKLIQALDLTPEQYEKEIKRLVMELESEVENGNTRK